MYNKIKKRAQQLLRWATVWQQQTWAEKWAGAAVGGWVPTGSPSDTMWPGLRPTSLPSGMLIHPTVDHNCRNATLLRVGIPLRTIFICSLVITPQNIFSTLALSYCSIPIKIKQIMF